MTDDVLRLASAALGAPVTDPEPLGGSHRSLVLRCVTPTGTVVVKKPERVRVTTTKAPAKPRYAEPVPGQ